MLGFIHYDEPIFHFCWRFLLKHTKAQGEEDGKGATETTAMLATSVAKETTSSPPSQPDPAPSQLETPTELSVQSSSPHSPMETLPLSPATTATSTLSVQQEEVPNSQNTVQPKFLPNESGRPEEDGEKAGPSGLSIHPFPSSSAAPSAPFIPFSGGGQRLGGPEGGAMGGSLSSSSSLSAMTAVVESPKAKKAKSSHSSGIKVSWTREDPYNLF